MSKQTTIHEVYPEPPKAVTEAAATYLKHKRGVASGREKMNSARDALIEVMRENDVTEMLVDDGEKRLTLTSEDKVHVEARKKAKAETA